MLSYRFFGGYFAGAKPSVKFEKTFPFRLRDVLIHSGGNHRIVLEDRLYALVRSETESAEKHGGGEFTRSVYFYPKSVVRVLFELYPRAPVRDNGSSEHFSARLGKLKTVVYAR